MCITYSIKNLCHPSSDKPRENACAVRKAVVQYRMYKTSSVTGIVGAQL